MRLLIYPVLLAAASIGFAADPPKPPPFAEVVAKNFARWDKDKNGELSLDEVNRAIGDPAVKGPEAAAVAALRRGMKSPKGGPAKVTVADLTAQKQSKPAAEKPAAEKTAAQKKEPDGKKSAPMEKGGAEKSAPMPMEKGIAEKPPEPPRWSSLYLSTYQRLGRATRELYAKGKPSLEHLHQGRLGDCYCLAPLGAVCFRNADDVTRMITTNKDGTFGVHLGKEVITVPAPTDGELAISGSTEGEGMWVNVYEKAVGEWRTKHSSKRDKGAPAIELLGKGGSAGTYLALLTGHKVERYSLGAFRSETFTGEQRDAKLKELRGRLERTFAEGRLITTGTGDLKTKPPGIHPKHAYAVLGYDKKADKVLMWNPHGQTFRPKGPEGWDNGYQTSKGKFQIPLVDFVRLFGGLAIEAAPVN